jgi:hypothetical protein
LKTESKQPVDETSAILNLTQQMNVLQNQLDSISKQSQPKPSSHDELLEMWKRKQFSSNQKPIFGEQKLRQQGYYK